MSNKIKNIFTIKDLENLTGIKAHTIRIWEKRYSVLEPMRTEANIRYYDTHSLQKILNISTLHSFGYKISVIAKMSPEKITATVREVLSNKSLNTHVINNMKLAMMNFDQALFFTTYSSLSGNKSFREIFYDVFIPLLEEIGQLWQTETITPAHEHFISNLIRQKIASNTETLQHGPPTKTERTFVLYLPENEIHEIGLMFLNYELLRNGYKTVYIGESVPLDSLKDIKDYFDNTTFVTYMTVAPARGDVSDYISMIKKEILNDSMSRLCVFGRHISQIKPQLLTDGVMTYSSISEFTEAL